MVNVASMMDSIGATAGNIPTSIAFAGAYVSGTGDVPWNALELGRFTEQQVVRIYQGAGSYPGVGGYDMIDIETGAVTPPQAASEVEKRVQNNYMRTLLYGTRDSLTATFDALNSIDVKLATENVYCFLADWNLNEAEAEALLGTVVEGMTCAGVQWASPSSNPNTIPPGMVTDLKELNIDLSVVDASFLPISRLPVSTVPPMGPDVSGMVVYEWTTGDYLSKPVSSDDGGVTWHQA